MFEVKDVCDIRATVGTFLTYDFVCTVPCKVLTATNIVALLPVPARARERLVSEQSLPQLFVGSYDLTAGMMRRRSIT